MLVTLEKNSTASPSAVVNTISKVLTGVISSPSQLDSTYWTTSTSSWYLGDYRQPRYWSEVYNSTSGSTGYLILSIDSALGPTHKNYLVIYYGTKAIYYATCTGVVSNQPECVSEPYLAGYAGRGLSTTATDFVSSRLYIRFADGFVNIWSPNYSQTDWTFKFLGVEMVRNAYDPYSKEASFKAISFANVGTTSNLVMSTAISGYYAPKTDTYTSSKRLTSSYPASIGISAPINLSRASNSVDAGHYIAPISVRNLPDGWIGDSLSDLTGTYLTTSNGTYYYQDNDIITVGKTRYIVYNSKKTAMSGITFLLRI